MEIIGRYGSPEGVPMENVLREIIDYSCGDGKADLVVPVSPQFMLLEYDQVKAPLLEMLNSIAYMIGWEVEYTAPAPNFRPTYTLKEGPRLPMPLPVNPTPDGLGIGGVFYTISDGRE